MRSGRWRAYWLGSNGHDTYDERYHGLGMYCARWSGERRFCCIWQMVGSSASHMMEEEEFWLFGSKWSRWT